MLRFLNPERQSAFLSTRYMQTNSQQIWMVMEVEFTYNCAISVMRLCWWLRIEAHKKKAEPSDPAFRFASMPAVFKFSFLLTPAKPIRPRPRICEKRKSILIWYYEFFTSYIVHKRHHIWFYVMQWISIHFHSNLTPLIIIIKLGLQFLSKLNIACIFHLT